jgi:hypothetical protein
MEAAAVAQAAPLIVQSWPMGDETAAGGLQQDRTRPGGEGLRRLMDDRHKGPERRQCCEMHPS